MCKITLLETLMLGISDVRLNFCYILVTTKQGKNNLFVNRYIQKFLSFVNRI